MFIMKSFVFRSSRFSGGVVLALVVSLVPMAQTKAQYWLPPPTIYINADTTINDGSVFNLFGTVILVGASGQGGALNPTINIIEGGSVRPVMDALNTSTINVKGGYANALASSGSSTINMIGGGVGSLTPRDSSTANVSGGAVNYLASSDTSTLNVSGGAVRDLSSSGNSTTNITGGTFIGYGNTYDDPRKPVSILGEGSAVFNITGGNLIGDIFALGSSQFNLFGTGLKSILDDPNIVFSPTGASYPISSASFFDRYALDGTLSDGTSLKGHYLYIQDNSNAKVNLKPTNNIPEPTTLALLALGGVGMVLRRRK
jgi:PEP-CTERM motif